MWTLSVCSLGRQIPQMGWARFSATIGMAWARHPPRESIGDLLPFRSASRCSDHLYPAITAVGFKQNRSQQQRPTDAN